MNGEYLGMSVIVSVGNQLFTGPQKQGALLVNYDESNDTYTGVIFPKSEKFTQFFTNLGKGEFAAGTPINVGVVLRVSGLRRYPYEERPNYAFQFVLPGEDTAPLLEIATQNAVVLETPVVEEIPTVDSNVSNVSLPPISVTLPKWQQLGYSSKQDWVAWGKPDFSKPK